MTRKLCITTTFVAISIGAAIEAAADGNASCEAVMYLFGEATGDRSGNACNKYLNPYYSIKVFGFFCFNSFTTANKRKQFPQRCSNTDTVTIAVANSGVGSENSPGTNTTGVETPVDPSCNGPGHCTMHVASSPTDL